jgi:hypothetical protein
MRAAPLPRFWPIFGPFPASGGGGFALVLPRKKRLAAIVPAPKFDLYMAVLNPGIAPA